MTSSLNNRSFEGSAATPPEYPEAVTASRYFPSWASRAAWYPFRKTTLITHAQGRENWARITQSDQDRVIYVCPPSAAMHIYNSSELFLFYACHSRWLCQKFFHDFMPSAARTRPSRFCNFLPLSTHFSQISVTSYRDLCHFEEFARFPGLRKRRSAVDIKNCSSATEAVPYVDG